MLNFKYLGVIGICFLAFTLMSFSSNSEALYNAKYYSNIENTAVAELNNDAWVVAAVRFVAVGTRHAVRYTRLVARVSAPFVNHAVRQMIFLSHTEGHSSQLYKIELEQYKGQQMESLN